MAAISTGDYVSQSAAEIFSSDINDRIETLKGQIRESLQEGDEPFDEDVAEYDELREFRDRVQAETGNHFDQATIVPDDRFEDHARDWAHGISDFEFLEKYVDWAEFAKDLRTDRYIQMSFGDDLVWVR